MNEPPFYPPSDLKADLAALARMIDGEEDEDPLDLNDTPELIEAEYRLRQLAERLHYEAPPGPVH